MKLAKAFADIDSAYKEPAEVTIKRFMPIGALEGTGSIAVSAFEAIVPSREIVFRGVRFEVTSEDEYASDGVVVVAVENAEKLIASIEHLANVTITTDRFALSEIETVVDGLRIVLFNTERGKIHAAIDADGTTCHLLQQSELFQLSHLVRISLEHLQSNTSVQ